MQLRVVAGHLDHAALGRQAPVQDHQPARRLERMRERSHHVLARRLLGFAPPLRRTCDRSPSSRSGRRNRPGPGAGRPGGCRRRGRGRPRRSGRPVAGRPTAACAADRVEVVDRRAAPRPRGPSPAGAARHWSSRPWSRRRRWRCRSPAGEDVARAHAAAQDVHDQFAAARADVALARIFGRHAARAHRGQAAELHRHGHRVGGELSAARAGAGAGEVLDRLQLFVGDLARRVRADGFVDVLDGQVAIAQRPGMIEPP